MYPSLDDSKTLLEKLFYIDLKFCLHNQLLHETSITIYLGKFHHHNKAIHQ